MTSIKKISYIQLAVLLSASRLFSEAVNFPLSNSEYGMQRFAVIFTACAILFVQYIPLMYLAKKYPGESAVSIVINRCRPLGWIYGILISVSVLISAVSALCRHRFYASSTIFEQAPPVLMIVLLLLACGFALWKGIQGTARSGIIFAGIFVAFLILMTVSVWGLLEPKWLYPALIEDNKKFIKEVLEQIGSNSEIMFFAVLAEHVEEKAHRAIMWYLPVMTVILELMFLLEMLVLGPFLGSANFPFYTVSSLSNIVLFQRLDGIDVAVWTLMCIVKIALALLCIRTVFDRLAGKKAGMIISLSGLVIVGVLAAAYGGSTAFVKTVTRILTIGIPMITTGILFPIITIILAKKIKKKGGENGEKKQKS